MLHKRERDFSMGIMEQLRDALHRNGNSPSEIETWGTHHVSAGIRLRLQKVNDGLVDASVLYLPMPSGKLVSANRFKKEFRAPNHRIMRDIFTKTPSFFTVDDDPKAFATAMTIRNELGSVIGSVLNTPIGSKNYWNGEAASNELRIVTELGFNPGTHFNVEEALKHETEWFKTKAK